MPVEDKDLFVNAYPNSKIIGEFNGALSRSGERIILRDQDNNPVDEVRYQIAEDGHPMPMEVGQQSNLDFNADNQSAESGRAVMRRTKPPGKAILIEGRRLRAVVQIHNGENSILVFWMPAKSSLMTSMSLRILTDGPAKF